MFFRGISPKAGEAFWRGLTKSRRLSGVNVFSGNISERWRDFLQRIDQKPKAVRSCIFSGYRSRPLGEPHDRWEKAAESGRALNIFPGYISEGWKGFLLSIDPKPKVVRSCIFSGYRSEPLGEPRSRYGKAAESGRALKLF